MSPAQYPSGQPDPFASSNSTANQFLGTSRKPWMNYTAPALRTRPEPKTLSSPNSKSAHSSKKLARQNPPDSSATSMHTQARLGSSSSPSISIPAPEQKAITLPTQFVPASPSTPGETQPVTKPPGTVAVNSNATFPSPESSNASHASPVAVAEGRHPVSAQPAPKAGGLQTVTTPRAPSLSSFKKPASVRTQPNPRPPSLAQPQAASSPPVSIWKIAREKLRSYLASSTRPHSLSETVELPRARILQAVCSTEDMFYLALHQLFCLSSYSPTQLQQLLKYGIRPDYDFGVVAQLLVDNKRLPFEFVKWSAEYPLPLDSMLKIEAYTLALPQVSRCLSMIAQHWSVFEGDIRNRGHPPQVDELVVRLGIVSPVFQTIAFTAVSRRLFGARDELFKACMSLFEDDQRTYRQRCVSSASARQQWVLAYFEKYRHLCAMHGVLPQQPVANIYKDGRLSSGHLPTTTTLNTPQIQHIPPANNAHPPLSNHPPNIHSVDAYSLSSNCPPNHHTSANMNASPHQQPQQPSYHHQGPMQAPRSDQQAQIRQQYAIPSQPPPPLPFPPPPPFHMITPQGNATVATTAPNQIPPSNSQPHQYPPSHMKHGPHGIPVSTSAAGTVSNVNMEPVLHSPHQLPRNLFPVAQPPPHTEGQGKRTTYPQSVSQPVPHPDMVNVAQSTTIPTRPSPGHYAQQPIPSNPPAVSVQPNGASPMALRHLLPAASHQAIPHPAHPRPATTSSTTEQSPEIIQYFSDFAIPIQKLPSNRSAFSWKFTVPREMLSRRSRLIPQANGRGYLPVLTDGDVSYRLRCIRYQGRLDLNSVSAWSQAENYWPDVVYIHVNNKEIFRPQNSKQLPLQINTHLKDGVNDIRLNVLRTSQQRAKNTTYAVAVEIVQVKSPRSFQSLIKKLPVQESRKQIQNRLSLSHNDDDLMIVDDFVSIDLRDPFTAKIFEVPARGLLCTHRECFDLSTFLQTLSTRPSATKRAAYVRCPICRQDARPSLLVIDEFLVEVRAALAQQQKLETTKALRVKSDGSWEAVIELESDTRTSTRKRDRASFEADLVKNEESSEATPSRTPAAPEIIELD
ncbi:hypothetical protein UA08_08323 [Talaromyces atroroseus]|uniref:SP-RING-type domain-containing protein n=1 Tax=Talaromyces atroroseus TaxID=1441469 RepID=A0A225A7K5_TALAT|nr:hypothetical protein UA08_08323 [Talaromyces atroroseus]OKL56502.1 hypothetical protein UA08_08323 [Talaromyces atroroseus]